MIISRRLSKTRPVKLRKKINLVMKLKVSLKSSKKMERQTKVAKTSLVRVRTGNIIEVQNRVWLKKMSSQL